MSYVRFPQQSQSQKEKEKKHQRKECVHRTTPRVDQKTVEQFLREGGNKKPPTKRKEVNELQNCFGGGGGREGKREGVRGLKCFGLWRV